jgi:hypothetical protein
MKKEGKKVSGLHGLLPFCIFWHMIISNHDKGEGLIWQNKEDARDKT